MLPRSAFHENGVAEAPQTNAPVAPPASAVRISAPTLPGSWTSTAASTNACGWPQSIDGAVTFLPDDRGDARWSLHGTDRRKYLVVSRDDVDRRGFELACQLLLLGAAVSLDAATTSSFEFRSGGTRVAHQMRAIQQDAFTGRVGVVRERAKGAHDGVLSARNGLHAGWLCYSRFQMKERILKRFNDEIAALERELKVDLPKEIQRARELGDLRENAEYKSAKERQEIVNARIAMLKKRVGEISMINLDRIPHDRAGFGSTVHLRDGNGDTIVYQLVMPEESDFEKGMISTSSPIGRAILNKEEGDEIKVTTPNGPRKFELIKVFTIHDEA